ncbi:MAG: hypothetical protein HLUCCA04_05100 [Oceanicaulis sp. HLUCCA04]|nr:MAG: hypothetical protein HLUCCA04_05100 [Oceanicaulis sp. HLUCCA04]
MARSRKTPAASKTQLDSLDDCRSAASPARQIILWPDRLEETAEGTLVRRIALETIEEVRLSVEPSGIGAKDAAQIICRVSGGGKTIAFSSLRSTGILKWENQADRFAVFLRSLHGTLTDREGVAYIEGAPLTARLKAFLPALLIAMTGVAIALWGLTAGQIITGLIGLVLAVAGGYSAWVFRPMAEKPYDPAKFS